MHYKALIFTIKYATGINEYFYQMKPEWNINATWALHGYIAVDYAGDNNTPRKVLQDNVFSLID